MLIFLCDLTEGDATGMWQGHYIGPQKSANITLGVSRVKTGIVCGSILTDGSDAGGFFQKLFFNFFHTKGAGLLPDALSF